jgi:hypothetical protein
MITPDSMMANIHLPEGWEIINQGTERFRGRTPRVYIVVATPTDVITIVAYLNCKAEDCTIEVGWKIIEEALKLQDHTVTLVEHPQGGRLQYIWYCPRSNATFMINFSTDVNLVWNVLSKLQCH